MTMRNRLDETIGQGLADGLHALVVVHDGQTMLEHYGVGEDFSWGTSLGIVDFGPHTLGNGGQRLTVLPDLGLVVAIAAGNYDDPEQWRTPAAVLERVVIGSRFEP